MSEKPQSLVIGIAGGTGSGKTTVANVILDRVGKEHIAYLPHDAYYRELIDLPPDQKATVNFDHPDSLETELMINHIKELKNGKSIRLPIYNFSTNSRTGKTIRIDPQRVIIIEGILIFVEPELRKLLDVKLFVDTNADIRFIRRLQRDINERGRTMEMVIHQYLTTVRPMHLDFVEPSKRYANVIIPEGGIKFGRDGYGYRKGGSTPQNNRTMMEAKKKQIFLLRVVLLIGLLILTVLLLHNRDQIQKFSKYGYTGIFFISILSNATIIMPIPGVVLTSAMGAVFNPFWVALAAGCGAALGELTGYLAGFSGQFVVERKDWYQKLTNWMKKYGELTVLIMAFIPNPLFDLTGIAAGALKMPFARFLFWCVIGKILKMLLFAFTGSSMMQSMGL